MLRAGTFQLRCERCKSSTWHPRNWRGELGRRCTKQKSAVLRWYFPGMKRKQAWMEPRELRMRLGRQAEGGGPSHLIHITALGCRYYYYPRWSNFPQRVGLRAGTQTPTPKFTLSPCSVSSMFTGPLCWEWLGGAGWGWKTTQEALTVIYVLSPCIVHKKLTVHWGKTFQLMGHPRYLVIPLTRCHWDLQALFQSWDESEFQRR